MKDFNLQIMFKKSLMEEVREKNHSSGNRGKRSLIYAVENVWKKKGHFCIFLRLVISLEIRNTECLVR